MDELSTRLYTWRRGLPLLPRKWWEENKDWADGSIVSIPLARGTHYYIPDAHRSAHAQHDPLLAPHGFFRALPPKRNTAAIEFVERFGPFTWPNVAGEKTELVLGDFWAKHLRYVSVVRLWEGRDDEYKLRSAFSDLYKNIHQIQFAEGWDRLSDDTPELVNDWLDLGGVPHCQLGGSHSSRRRYLLPWEKGEGTPEEWLDRAPFEKLREAAIGIFHSELNAHLLGRGSRWLRRDVDDPERPVSFQLFFSGGDLWQIMWELTGLDTAEGRSWRLCPACNVFFYPKRSDQYYCRSEEQIRASKRNYARTRRKRERLRKLLDPLEHSTETPGSAKKNNTRK